MEIMVIKAKSLVNQGKFKDALKFMQKKSIDSLFLDKYQKFDLLA